MADENGPLCVMSTSRICFKRDVLREGAGCAVTCGLELTDDDRAALDALLNEPPTSPDVRTEPVCAKAFCGERAYCSEAGECLAEPTTSPAEEAR